LEGLSAGRLLLLLLLLPSSARVTTTTPAGASSVNLPQFSKWSCPHT